MKDLINFYRVKNLEITKAFYQDIMGFEIYKDQGKCLIYDMHFGKLGFCVHFPEEAANNSCITFVYDSKEEVDKLYKKFNECGYKPSLPEKNKYFKIYHFFLNDPNGLKIECQVFLD